MDGSGLVARYLKAAGIRYMFGIPGHGNAALIDALKEVSPAVEFIPVKHEQWGGHMADGYFRANRRKIAAITTSVGPGATNLATPLATAYVDSSAFLAITGDIQTYLFGMGIFQEINRQQAADYVNMARHLVKRAWLVSHIQELPRVLESIQRTALGGRPGPVLVDIPMDIQIERVEDPSVADRWKSEVLSSFERPQAVQGTIKQAAEILLQAERPLMLIGGGVSMSGATDEAISVAETLGMPVVCSFRGDAKGGFPEDHELYAFHPGNIGNPVANKIVQDADVILAVGTTFSDETTSSYSRDFGFRIPPTRLIQIDIDPEEIGRNYPVTVGIVSDAKIALSELKARLSHSVGSGRSKKSGYLLELHKLKESWEKEVQELRKENPMGIPNMVKVLQDNLAPDSIVTVSAGLPQEIMGQLWIARKPNTFLSSGGFSTMGFALPAAIGAKLACPDKLVVAVEGDGSLLMNSAELLTAVQLGLPIVVVIFNNFGWISIRDLQMRNFGGRLVGTEFRKTKGNSICAPDFERLVKSYGAEYRRAETPGEFSKALKDAIRTEVPSAIEVLVEKEFPRSGTKAYGFWDLPKRS